MEIFVAVRDGEVFASSRVRKELEDLVAELKTSYDDWKDAKVIIRPVR